MFFIFIKKKIMTNPIIVIGTSHHNTLGIIKALGLQHVKSIAYIYGCKHSYIEKSKFVKEILIFETCDDAILFLKSQYCTADSMSSATKPIVISCTDEVAYKLDQIQVELLPYLKFFHSAISGRLTKYMDKQEQIELARKVGLHTPWSIIYKKDTDISKMKFPCILKPVASINGGKHICICNDKTQFDSAIKEYNDISTIIQELIIKKREIVIVGLTINRRTIIPAYIEKEREIKGGTTYSQVFPSSKLPSGLIDACEKMIEDIGYEGLWGVECIQNDNNTYYFIEINLRSDATTYSVAVAGANLPYRYLLQISGLEMSETYTIRTISSIVEHNDLTNALKQQISIKRWYKDFKKAECRYFFSMRDYGPISVLLCKYVRIFIMKIFGKIKQY